MKTFFPEIFLENLTGPCGNPNGLAIAENITGPWTKYERNPVLQKPGELEGVGQSAMFTDNKGQMKIVFHSHAAPGKIHPRKAHTAIVSFVKNGKYKYEIIEINLASLKTLNVKAAELK